MKVAKCVLEQGGIEINFCSSVLSPLRYESVTLWDAERSVISVICSASVHEKSPGIGGDAEA